MKPITIIGGGLAGLTLGILLRRENIPVTLHEALRYPRHRVCGEFLSGTGRQILREIAPKNLAISEGSSTAIFLNRQSLYLNLPEPALCASRFELDAQLAKVFQNLGGDLKTNSRPAATNAPGLVQASGRRRADPAHGHLLGLKAHAANVFSAADLELHFAPNRYVGICRLPNNLFNICGLFYSTQPIHDLQNRWAEILSDNIPSLTQASWQKDSFCAVAAITLDQHFDPAQFAIGDAAAMIPPLTGNGMSMALESAALAAPTLISYAREKISWPEALSSHQKSWNTTFRPRLRWAAYTQRLAFSTHSQRLLFTIAKNLPIFAQFLLTRTR
jgi:flavin-dependent dehydrogenase